MPARRAGRMQDHEHHGDRHGRKHHWSEKAPNSAPPWGSWRVRDHRCGTANVFLAFAGKCGGSGEALLAPRECAGACSALATSQLLSPAPSIRSTASSRSPSSARSVGRRSTAAGNRPRPGRAAVSSRRGRERPRRRRPARYCLLHGTREDDRDSCCGTAPVGMVPALGSAPQAISTVARGAARARCLAAARYQTSCRRGR
jgi:hypothetical protein